MYLGYDPDRIGITPIWLETFIDMHKKNHPGAKFKIGNKVLYKKRVCTILAVNVQRDDEVEYALDNYVFQLVWEEELTKIVLNSDSKLACQDHCQYDSGHNCAYCDRFFNTLYYKKKKGENK